MMIQTRQISPALKLHIIPNDAFHTCTLNVCFIYDLSEESAAEITLLPRVLERGCRKYPTAAAISAACDMLYGSSINAFSSPLGEMQIIGFSASFIDSRYIPDGINTFEQTLDILCNIIFDPLTENGKFSDSYVDTEKANLIDELKNRDDKAELARFNMEGIMFDGEKFAICADGEIPTAEKITSASLYEFYQNFLKTAKVEIFYSGRADNTDEVFDKLADAFSKFDHEPLQVDIADVIRQVPAGRPIEKICESDITQSRLCIGYRTGSVLQDNDDNFLAFLLACEIIGRSPINKLFTNLREREQICYSCTLSTEVFKGVMRIECGISECNFEKAKEVIAMQIADTASKKFTNEELDAAKRSLSSAYISIEDDLKASSEWFMRRSIAGRSDSPHEALIRVDSITPDQIAAAASKIQLDTIYFLKGNSKSGECGDCE